MRAKPVPSIKALCKTFEHSAGREACVTALALMQYVDVAVSSKNGTTFVQLLAVHAPQVYHDYVMHLEKRHARYSALMRALDWVLKTHNVVTWRGYDYLNAGDMSTRTIFLDRATFRLSIRDLDSVRRSLRVKHV